MSLRLGHQLMVYISFTLPLEGFVLSYEAIQKLLKRLENKNYHLTTLRKEYSVLKKDGYVEHKTRYRKPVPILTQKGKLAIKTRLAFKYFGTWDEKWRMVIFDIPEKERKSRLALRHKLKELGFGQVQKSVYVSPFPLLYAVNRFTCDLGVRQYLRLAEISKIDDEVKLIEKIWRISEVNKKYSEFIKNAKKQLSNKNHSFWPLKAKILESEFAKIYETDPHLPTKFLPKNWTGVQAYKSFKEISNSY